jgi:hypothetical protein
MSSANPSELPWQNRAVSFRIGAWQILGKFPADPDVETSFISIYEIFSQPYTNHDSAI